AQGLEGVPQLQVFCLSIDGGALPGRGDPGAADLDTPMVAVDIHITGRTYRLADGPGYGGEADPAPRLLPPQVRLDPGPHVFLRAHGIGQIAPDFLVCPGAP